MDNKLIGEQITRYRKEKNLTQEELGRAAGVSTQAVSRWENGGAPDVALLPAIADKLGVTIDALFGRDGGERVDIRETMLQWARTLPKGKRLDQFCRLVWSLLIRGGLTETELPKIDYPAQGKLEGDGRLLLSQFRLLDGIVLDVHSDEFSFVTIWPEPEAGYDAFLAPKSEYRKFFQLLARPGCLELLEYMYSTEIHYFVPEVAAKQTRLPLEQVKEILEEMDERQMVWSMVLELPTGTVKAYQTTGLIQLVPVLYTSRCLMQRGMNLTYQSESDVPTFKGGLWKDEKESSHEKK
ncbi:MAG: helix-turn-helix transcriptional regulator [Oscillospiraceae bacterium]|jgi:transcriptional regulator with XRE-family HTH domain|nr:helix-turn-helix transcriptional regulator [Oscillospiraceae bacterium]